MANLFIFDPEIASPDERRNFWAFLVSSGKVVNIEEGPVSTQQGSYWIRGRVFERLPFEVWGSDRDDAILQAIRSYRQILMTVGTVIDSEVENFKKSQGA